ncbi:hypothetical protein NU688_14200 [Variovorax sp. ZS18.2.2]|uniref:DUF6891 domain-containing protein n=1 Tax=Variovorax sp. ZS18.2.2 TaxID=2971255 RepID=UPI00215148BB|nr:hypothetical protein [Variovorax sp. ZS18.2.2]MCR6477309.1 hypothetical protein [Variovorax sp. ZS18.2.2]
MPLNAEVLDEIHQLVRGGFEKRARIVEIVCEELYEPGELDDAEVESAIDEAFTVLEKEQAVWPTITDCDKLDQVFSALEQLGIIALQNAGHTQSDGYEDVQAAYAESEAKSSIVGYCFYHGQDLDRVVRDGALFLAFGPIDPEKEESDGPRIGEAVVAELARAGLAVQWDGSCNSRILVMNIDWKRRRLGRRKIW